ncbi:MAG: hypothetical protein JSR48_00845 [Verrucomicrobia bacterium]|nr:hypothetical protein [Verrucomicrobiota bacterium]
MLRVVLLAAGVFICAALSAAPLPPGIEPDATYSGAFAFVRPDGVDTAMWREVLRGMMQQLQGVGSSGDFAVSQDEMIVRFRSVPGSSLQDIYNLPNVRVSALTKDPKQEAAEEPPQSAPPPAAPATQPWTGNGPISEEGARGIPIKTTSGPFYQEEENPPKPAPAESGGKGPGQAKSPAYSGPGNGPINEENLRGKLVRSTSGPIEGEPIGYATGPMQGKPVENTSGPFAKEPAKAAPATDREGSVESFWAAPMNVWDRNSSAYGDGSRIIYVKLKGTAQPQRIRFDLAKQLGYLPANLAPGDVPEKEP